MSENDKCHFAGTTEVAVKSHGNECLKRQALRCPQKTDVQGSSGADCSKYRQQQQRGSARLWTAEYSRTGKLKLLRTKTRFLKT